MRRTTIRQDQPRALRVAVTLSTVLLLAVVGATPALASPGATTRSAPAPAPVTTPATAGQRTFVVETSTARVASQQADRVARAGGTITRRYRTVLHGFAATMTSEQAQRLRHRRGVRAVAADRVLVANPCLGCPPEALERESVSNWGLLRLSSRTPVSLVPDQPNGPLYTYDSDGEGVTAFVLDSGITAATPELSGRVRPGRDFVGRDADATDCSGHGTRVAEVVGGTTTGVADHVSLVPLRVFNCADQGRWSDVLAAMDWALHHRPKGPAVVNLSGSSAAFPLGDRAVRSMIRHGLPVVVSAGNADTDACQASPARAAAALTVASTTLADRRAPRSSYGSCVDLFAPGADIATTSGTVSGTSFAAAHVTGAVARYLENHRSASPARVAAYLRGQATTGAVQDAHGTRNRLLYLPAPVPPTAPRLVRWAVDDQADTITARWSPPADRGSAHLTGYAVCFSARNVITQYPGPVCSYASAKARTLTIGGGRDGVDLEDDGIYSVYVVAISKAGSGAAGGATDLHLASSRPLPTAPTVSAVPDEEVGGILVFVTPGPANGSGPVTGYRWSRDGVDRDGNGPLTVTTDTVNNFYEFQGAVPGFTYHISVALVTADGVGEATTITATYPH